MNRLGLARLVEAFFSRLPIYMLLVGVSVGFGVLQVQRGSDEYVSTGAILVDNQSFVEAQSGIQVNGYNGYLSPAQYTSQELYGLIRTDAFLTSVLAAAEIELSPFAVERSAQVGSVRAGFSTWPASSNITEVNMASTDPSIAQRVARAIIDEFIALKVQVDLAESGASREFFAEVVEPLRRDLTEARAAVDAAVATIDPETELSASRELEIERLKAAEVVANEAYLSTLDELNVAELAELQTDTTVGQNYIMLDAPDEPALSTGRLFNDLMALMMFAFVGIILAIVAPLVAALTNTSVVFAEDVIAASSVPIVAVVPRCRRRSIRLGGSEIERPGTGAVETSEETELGEFIDHPNLAPAGQSGPAVA